MGEKYGSGSWFDRQDETPFRKINKATPGWVFQRANKRTGLIEYLKLGIGSDVWTRTLDEALVYANRKAPGTILHVNYNYEIVKVTVRTTTQVVRA